jgi:hypothetical protein
MGAKDALTQVVESNLPFRFSVVTYDNETWRGGTDKSLQPVLKQALIINQ